MASCVLGQHSTKQSISPTQVLTTHLLRTALSPTPLRASVSESDSQLLQKLMEQPYNSNPEQLQILTDIYLFMGGMTQQVCGGEDGVGFGGWAGWLSPSVMRILGLGLRWTGLARCVYLLRQHTS